MAVSEKIRIKIKGYEHATVDAAAAKIVEAAKNSGASVSGPIPLPTEKEIVTILRAVHKYKDSREQFEQRTHKVFAWQCIWRAAYCFGRSAKRYRTVPDCISPSLALW